MQSLPVHVIVSSIKVRIACCADGDAQKFPDVGVQSDCRAVVVNLSLHVTSSGWLGVRVLVCCVVCVYWDGVPVDLWFLGMLARCTGCSDVRGLVGFGSVWFAAAFECVMFCVVRGGSRPPPLSPRHNNPTRLISCG